MRGLKRQLAVRGLLPKPIKIKNPLKNLIPPKKITPRCKRIRCIICGEYKNLVECPKCKEQVCKKHTPCEKHKCGSTLPDPEYTAYLASLNTCNLCDKKQIRKCKYCGNEYCQKHLPLTAHKCRTTGQAEDVVMDFKATGKIEVK